MLVQPQGIIGANKLQYPPQIAFAIEKNKNLSTHCRVKDLSPTSEDRCTKQVCHILDQHVGKISRLRDIGYTAELR